MYTGFRWAVGDSVRPSPCPTQAATRNRNRSWDFSIRQFSGLVTRKSNQSRPAGPEAAGQAGRR
ncbi:MAG: hypothetical protein AB7N71_04670, partial [Phycisphaerae bacterium]